MHAETRSKVDGKAARAREAGYVIGTRGEGVVDSANHPQVDWRQVGFVVRCDCGHDPPEAYLRVLPIVAALSVGTPRASRLVKPPLGFLVQPQRGMEHGNHRHAVGDFGAPYHVHSL